MATISIVGEEVEFALGMRPLRGHIPRAIFVEQFLDMGKVAKQCKNQWMRCTETGLKALLQFRLMEYANPDHYRTFSDEYFNQSTKTTTSCDLVVEATKRKSRVFCDTIKIFTR